MCQCLSLAIPFGRPTDYGQEHPEGSGDLDLEVSVRGKVAGGSQWDGSCSEETREKWGWGRGCSPVTGTDREHLIFLVFSLLIVFLCSLTPENGSCLRGHEKSVAWAKFKKQKNKETKNRTPSWITQGKNEQDNVLWKSFRIFPLPPPECSHCPHQNALLPGTLKRNECVCPRSKTQDPSSHAPIKYTSSCVTETRSRCHSCLPDKHSHWTYSCIIKT